MKQKRTFYKDPHLLAKSVYHTATYAGRTHILTAPQWMHILETTPSTVQRGIKKHGTMQAFIDAQFSRRSRAGEIWYKFIFKKEIGGVA